MFDPRDLATLFERAPRDVLSIILDVDPTKPENQTTNPAYRIWAHSACSRLHETLPEAARGSADESVRRVLAYLSSGQRHGRGLAIYAATDLWQSFELPASVPNRIAHGRADLLPVLWAGRMYQPYLVVIVDRKHAQIAVVDGDAVRTVAEAALELNTARWRFEGERPAETTRQTGVRGERAMGEADSFDAKIEARVHEFWQETARRLGPIATAEHADLVVISALAQAGGIVREHLAAPLRAGVVGIEPLYDHVSLHDVRDRTLPHVLAKRRAMQADDVAAAVNGAASARGLSGRERTLAALLEGEVRVLLAARDLEGDVRECGRCGYTTAEAPALCPACGNVMTVEPIRQVLPVVARAHGAELRVLDPDIGSRLPEEVGALTRFVVAAPGRPPAE